MTKLNKLNIGGNIVRKNTTYTVTDNTDLNNLVLSSTLLHAHKNTNGHNHNGQEEVYFFLTGSGLMQLGEKIFPVYPGDVVTIADGVFHRVFNNTNMDMYFVCVFDGGRKE